jgi:hypothetical protein
MNPGPLQILLDTLPQRGSIEWIGVRPARDAAMTVLEEVQINCASGLEGDRFSGRASSLHVAPVSRGLTQDRCD